MSNESYWDKTAETWEKTIQSKQNPHYHYYHTMDLLVADLLRREGVHNALELGCGTARCAINVLQTHDNTQVHIHGIDISPRMIEIGQVNLLTANLTDRITLQVGDVANLPYPANMFDVAFSRGAVLSYTQEPRQMLDHVHRVLRDTGVIGLDVITRPQAGNDSYVGKITPSTSIDSREIIYREWYTKENLQVTRAYRVESDTPLHTELKALFDDLPTHLPDFSEDIDA